MAKLHFYYAAMNAGKSTSLLQSNYNYKNRGMETLLLCPALDTRFGVGRVCSRMGLKANAVGFDIGFDIFDYVATKVKVEKQAIHCVLVDEAQFLSKAQVLQLTDVVDQLNIPVLTYGLRTDFRGEPFEGSMYLLALAEEIAELKTVCHCGSKATMTVRVDDHGHPIKFGSQIEIGGTERYIVTCRKHFKLGKVHQ